LSVIFYYLPSLAIDWAAQRQPRLFTPRQLLFASAAPPALSFVRRWTEASRAGYDRTASHDLLKGNGTRKNGSNRFWNSRHN
jgi:hypothetical protein